MIEWVSKWISCPSYNFVIFPSSSVYVNWWHACDTITFVQACASYDSSGGGDCSASSYNLTSHFFDCYGDYTYYGGDLLYKYFNRIMSGHNNVLEMHRCGVLWGLVDLVWLQLCEFIGEKCRRWWIYLLWIRWGGLWQYTNLYSIFFTCNLCIVRVGIVCVLCHGFVDLYGGVSPRLYRLIHNNHHSDCGADTTGATNDRCGSSSDWASRCVCAWFSLD